MHRADAADSFCCIEHQSLGLEDLKITIFLRRRRETTANL